jgi:hypothetical protein
MAHSSPDFEAVLRTLAKHEVQYIVVGGVAAVLHGAPLTTFDLDLVHSRAPENLVRLAMALEELDAYYRGRGDQRLRPTAENLASPGHHLLVTRNGPLDLLGTIGTGREFDSLLKHTTQLSVGELRLRVLNLDILITVKEEVGHEKDKAMLPLLRQTLKEKGKKWD